MATIMTLLAEAQLPDSPSARLDAELLLAAAMGKNRSFLRTWPERLVDSEAHERFDRWLERRRAGEPVAYILGRQGFWSLDLEVAPHTLIPRPDTECLVEQALARLPPQPCQILDLGTGTGAIALALASERPDCDVTAVDDVPDAVTLARRNAERLGLANVTVLLSHWFSAVEGRQFELIVSNPPYIDADDPHLAQGDVRFEPRSALVAAQEGLADIGWIIAQSRRFLRPGGWLMIEHGWRQGEAVRALFDQAGYRQTETCRDYGDNERLTLACWPVGAGS